LDLRLGVFVRPCNDGWKRSAPTFGAIGRNLNQIARVANQTGRLGGPSVDDLHQMLRACEVLRDHIKGLVNANTASWETGYDETHR
jgi:hypothetical protein